jgi:phage-related protein
MSKKLEHGPLRTVTEIGMTLGGAALTGLFQFAANLQVFQPIFEVLNALIELFAAEMLDELMPAFEDLMDVLMSDEFLDFIKLLARVFAAVLMPVIQAISSFLKLITGQAMTSKDMGQAIGGAIGAIVGALLASYIGMPWLGAILGAAINVGFDTLAVSQSASSRFV